MASGFIERFFVGIFAVAVLLICNNVVNAEVNDADQYSSPWCYKCEDGRCRKTEISPQDSAPLSLEVCQLFCGEAGSLWPKPTGHLAIGNFLVQLNPDDIEFHAAISTPSSLLLEKNIGIFRKKIKDLVSTGTKSGGSGVLIHLGPRISPDNVKLTLQTNESYVLQISELADGRLNASIDAETFFGARHALETLSQLIIYNDLRSEIQIVRDAYIADGPVYPYRGILLDTSRNFVDKQTILRTIRGMAMNKLNTFHWHITDSHSFPYQSHTFPQMTKYGAYTSKQVYSHEDVKEVIEYGLLNGVRVLPEFDAPAHVGEGWQWVGDNALICFNAQPWTNYCVEPPCGQLNPASNRVYQILKGIYDDMVADFQPDIFHMGGDEVNIKCWNTSDHLKDWMKSKGWGLGEADFFKAWDYFQSRAEEQFTLANGGNQVPIILWTSGLTTEANIGLLKPEKHVIQIWTTKEDPTIARLIKNNFKVIFSNYDALYLDCGFSAWVGKGNNWCSPYKGWQDVYDNSPIGILQSQGFGVEKKHLILGGEATLWSEQADTSAIDTRLWPRAAALGERLWAEPKSSWVHAEPRILRQRERMVNNGIYADSLQPQWCMQNQGYCNL